MSYIADLNYVIDKDFIGLKASNLFLLLKAGFNLPQTYCVNTLAYQDFIKFNNVSNFIKEVTGNSSLSNRDKSYKITRAIRGGIIPKSICKELRDVRGSNGGDIRWAVRSSSTMEDLPGFSFAGLYNSYLNVKGEGEILEAVKNCWASLWNERAIAYRNKNNLADTNISMAVIVQEMVPAECSGVIFTNDPVNVKLDRMILEYCNGLGELLVSGKVIPVSLSIERHNLSILGDKQSLAGANLNIENIGKIAEIALQIENYFGCPQDIEWAFSKNKFFILQSRPISAYKVGIINTDQIIWTRANVGEVLPDVITPLTWEIFRATLLNRPQLAMIKSDKEEGMHNPGIRRIHGRAYIRLNAFLASFCYLPWVNDNTLRQVLGVNLPGVTNKYKKPKGIAVRLAQGLFILNVFGLWPRISLMAGRLPDLPAGKKATIQSLIVWNARCFQLHLKATAYAIGTFGMLTFFLKRWIPEETDGLVSLILTGHENLKAAAQGFSLWQLAEKARKDQDLRQILLENSSWPVIQEQLSHVKEGKLFLEMFDSFMASNGARAAGEFELAVPRWREDSSFVLEVIQRFITTDNQWSPILVAQEKKEKQEKAILNILSSLRPHRRWLFKRLLTSYSNFSTLRENLKYRLIEGYASLRLIFLKTAKELVKNGRLLEDTDIFFLTPLEILDIQKETNFLLQINERKSQHAKWKSENAPELVQENEQEIRETATEQMIGIGCSPGIVEGSARVIMNISESHTLKVGEILVTPHTDPGWTPLFLTCKGVVSEIGGFLSHGATVAREYGIPAVVNVKEATKIIHTGDTLIVDGDKGTIIIKQRL
ncbi:MAG: PEP/pyruvate-binding domain-containing protein [Actinomycetota bacterium]